MTFHNQYGRDFTVSDDDQSIEYLNGQTCYWFLNPLNISAAGTAAGATATVNGVALTFEYILLESGYDIIDVLTRPGPVSDVYEPGYDPDSDPSFQLVGQYSISKDSFTLLVPGPMTIIRFSSSTWNPSYVIICSSLPLDSPPPSRAVWF